MEKPLQIIIKQSALNDLEEQYHFYAENYSLDFAEKFRTSFFNEIKTILPNPLKFSECRFLPTKNKVYRNIVWDNYLIIFKLKKSSVDVLVLHHTKQHPKKLKAARRIK
jgi:plasmid stabilization system protein ParE